ncbi:reverse transcriptase domain-containing protein [Tanacetum coccineum]
MPSSWFTELHQHDTFYNGLNPSVQDSLNSAAGGNLLERSAQDVLKIIENKSKVRTSRNKPIVSQTKASNVDSSEIASAVASVVTSAMTALFKQHQVTQAPAFVKAVEESCVTCGGAHSYRQCPATDGNTFSGYQDNIQGYVSAAAVNYNQGNTGYRPQSVANQIRPPGFAQPNVQNNQTRYNQGYNQDRGNYQGNTSYQPPIQQFQVATSSDLEKFKKTKEANMKTMQNQINNVKNELRNEMQSSIQNSMSNQTNELKNMMASFFEMNTASSSSPGPLPSNTIANPPVHNNQNRGNNYNPGNSTYRAPTPPTAPSNELANYMKVNETSMRAMQNQINNMKTELRNEFQATMLQQNNKLENMLSNYFQMNKPSGSGSGPLPSNTVNNPKGDLKAITTRSGVSYDGPPIPPPFSPSPKVVEREPEVTKDPVQSSAEKVQPPDVQPQAPTSESVDTPKPKPNIPYPSRLNNQKLRERDDHQMKKFLQIFRSLHFNLSFSDALLYMPKFASTFKNLLSNKEKLFEVANTPVNENCSAVILKKLPEKLGDPDKFLIPCNFPEIAECLALADLGASINVMPLSIWKNLSLPELTPTQMILELADRSTTIPTGIAEDVFVRVGEFHFLADFVVIDYVVDPRVPLILRRPFLRTTRALIDVYGEELTLRVGDEAITFKVGFFGNSENGNPTLISEPNIAKSSPSLTPFEGCDFILEEIEANLASDSVPSGIDSKDISEFFSTFPIPMENCDFFFKKTKRFTYFPEFENFRFDIKKKNSGSTTDHADVSLPEYERFYLEGDIRLLEKFLNEDPSSPLPPK